MYQLTIGLEGGLGNRMRVAAASATLAAQAQVEVAALWTRQWGMECRFDDLFLPCEASAQGHFLLRDATLCERLLIARPRARNLHLSRYLHKLVFRDTIYSHQVTTLCRQNFNFARWAHQGPVLLWTWWDFLPWEPSLLSHLFQPRPDILQRIDDYTADFSPHTVGAHIRRTDNQQSIEESPTVLFLEAIDEEITVHSDTRVYLATDDEPTKQLLRRRYGQQRIITSPQAANRGTVAGIQNALVEMYSLSRTCRIYGSAGSSFSEIAAKLGDIPLTILRQPAQQKNRP